MAGMGSEPGQGPKWGVCMLADLPGPMIAMVALSHLAQGAGEVWVFLDRPNAEAHRLLGGIPGIRLIDCDADFWAEPGFWGRGRPDQVFKRQIHCANLAYARAGVAWLFHLDADEFIDTGAPLDAELAQVPDSCDVFCVPNVERVLPLLPRGRVQTRLFEGVFRRPSRAVMRVAPLIYGRWADYYQLGLVGYAKGKSATRTGQGHIVKIHGSEAGPNSRRRPVLWHQALDARILHFDAVTPLHWQLKIMRRTGAALADPEIRYAAGRNRQIATMLEAQGDILMLQRMSRALLHISPAQVAALRAAGMLWRPRLDPEAGARQMQPEALMTPAEFDRLLLADPGFAGAARLLGR